MGEILVSIVTVAYNSEKTIARSIESVLNQSYKNVEYIVVEGLSKDNTLSIAKSYTDRFKSKGYSYSIISERDSGIYDAMNKGISLATGNLVGMINSDDWYERETVEKVVAAYQDLKFDVLYGDMRVVRKDGKSFIKKAKKSKIMSSRYWNHPTMFVKRDLYQRIQYENKTIYDDFDYILKVNKLGYKIEILNEILANFSFGGVSNRKNLKEMLERAKIKYRIYRKNGYSRLYFLECMAMEMAKMIWG